MFLSDFGTSRSSGLFVCLELNLLSMNLRAGVAPEAIRARPGVSLKTGIQLTSQVVLKKLSDQQNKPLE